jgi:hypothetical protein
MPCSQADPPVRRNRRPSGQLAAAGLILLALAVPTAVSGDDTAPRVQAGIRLFRSLLAADMGLEQRVDSEGRLLLLVFYSTDAVRADGVSQQLTTPAEGQPAVTIRGLPVAVALTSDPDFSAYQQHPPAAIFLAEPPKDDGLRRIVRYGIDHGLIVYSPFEGDVEKGILGGISVEAKVQPYLNQTTLDASHVTLRPFFLKVSKFTR